MQCLDGKSQALLHEFQRISGQHDTARDLGVLGFRPGGKHY